MPSPCSDGIGDDRSEDAVEVEDEEYREECADDEQNQEVSINQVRLARTGVNCTYMLNLKRPAGSAPGISPSKVAIALA